MILNIVIGVVSALLGAVLAFFSLEANVGGPQQQAIPQLFTNGLYVGDQGVLVSDAIFGTCNASTSQLPLEATSTDDFTCTVTGALAGDEVFVSLPSNGGSFLGGFTVTHAVASADTITFGILNQTGSATSSFPLATTSVQYWVLR